MSDNIKAQNSELFITLSEQQQEAATGGLLSPVESLDLIFTKTDIETYASNETDISVGDINYHNKQETGYKLSQTNLKINFFKFLLF